MRGILQYCREQSFAVSDPGMPPGILLASNLLLLAGGALLVAVLLLSVCRWPQPHVRRTNYFNLVGCLFLATVGGFLVVRSQLIYLFDYLDFATAADSALRGDLERYRKFCQVTVEANFVATINVLITMVLAVGVLLLVAAVLGLLWKRRLVHRLLHVACLAYYGLFAYYLFVMNRGISLIHAADVFGTAREVTSYAVLERAVPLVIPFALVLVAMVAMHVWYWRHPLLVLFRAADDTDSGPGDRIIEDVRTHGADPRNRKSMLNSMFVHVLVLFIIPWLAGLIGCVRDYNIQKGSGNPVVTLVKMVKPKPKKKKKRKYILNPQSAIIFTPPDIDDSPMLKEVEKLTQLTYNAGELTRGNSKIGGKVGGKMGEGGGKEGGWPDGSLIGEVRFIRLSYSGHNWDDGMAEWQRSDKNFLEYFFKLTELRIAKQGESHPASLLRRYRKGHAPPFVFMCGDGGISMSGRDEKALGDYLRDGGMLFADCGGAQWDGSFRSFIARVLPEKQLVVIPDDDPIFKLPFEFPSGAPPLWHHGGTRALGMKHGDRWCVFYHPGDVHDAWKTGNSGLRKEQADQAFEMGVNIVYYSFTRYLHATRKYRPKE